MKLFKEDPIKIRVLIGPSNCGKTRILNEMAEKFNVDKKGAPFLYIDGSMPGLTTPEGLSRTLSEALRRSHIVEIVANTGHSKMKSILGAMELEGGGSWLFGIKSGFTAKVSEALKNDENNLSRTLTNALVLFEAFQLLPRKPVLVIDEANAFMRWREDDPGQRQLRHFLQYLIAISRQDNLVHVVFATADCLIVDWLESNGLKKDQFLELYLGDLTKDEARDYVFGNKTWPGILNSTVTKEEKEVRDTAMAETYKWFGSNIGLLDACVNDESQNYVLGDAQGTWLGVVNKYAEAKKKLRDTAKAHWDEIYKWCGGNILELNECVAMARVKGDWKIALKPIVMKCEQVVKDGFYPTRLPVRDVAPLWTIDQWKMVLECIIAAEDMDYAVGWSELANKLDKTVTNVQRKNGVEGVNILLSLVKYNLLAVRLPSVFALKPQKACGATDGKAVRMVTLPKAGHVWAANALLRKMDKGKQDKKEGANVWLKIPPFRVG